VIVCAEGIPEATALSVFAPVMIFIKGKNSDKRPISATCLTQLPSMWVLYGTFPVSMTNQELPIVKADY
jgi:hypothetical protein